MKNQSLKRSVVNMQHGRKLPAVVIDAVKGKCSIKISENGHVLRGVPFTGGPLVEGDRVLVSYESGNPVVLGPGLASTATVTKRAITNRSTSPDYTAERLGGITGSQPASSIPVDTTNFNGIFDSGDSDLQTALETADDHSHAAATRQMNALIPGTLSTGSQSFLIPNNLGFSLTISKVVLHVGTAPTGAAIIVDINNGGTTIFTTQANRPQIAAAATTGNTTTIDVPTWADGEVLTVDIDQVGSGVAGADMTVVIIAS